MSTCISQHGEYSDHIPDSEYVCTRCGVLDEDGLIGELRALRLEREHLRKELRKLQHVLHEDADPVAAGWLPPDEAERLKAEINGLRAVLAASRDDPNYDPGPMVMLYDQAVDRADKAEAERAAVQPVIDAARLWRSRVGPQHIANFHVVTKALIDAVDALDAVSPLEGPKQ